MEDKLQAFRQPIVTATGILLVAVLHRVLRMDYPRDRAEAYHAHTLRFLITGVALSFAGALIDMFSHFMQE